MSLSLLMKPVSYMKQIELLNKKFDAEKLLDIYESLDNDAYQICFTDRAGKHSLDDGVGSIFDYHPCSEWDWSELNPMFHNTYLEEVYQEIKKDYIIGRARFMTMGPTNRALTYHYDSGHRLHIPIQTNPHAWFIQQDETLYNMDQLGSLYILDAYQYHSALNLDRSGSKRVHLVFSAEKNLK